MGACVVPPGPNRVVSTPSEPTKCRPNAPQNEVAGGPCSPNSTIFYYPETCEKESPRSFLGRATTPKKLISSMWACAKCCENIVNMYVL